MPTRDDRAPIDADAVFEQFSSRMRGDVLRYLPSVVIPSIAQGVVRYLPRYRANNETELFKAGAVIGGGAYAAMVVLLGELRADDRAALASIFRRRGS